MWYPNSMTKDALEKLQPISRKLNIFPRASYPLTKEQQVSVKASLETLARTMSIATLAVSSIAGVAHAAERPTPVEPSAPVVGGQVQPVRKPAVKFASRMKSPSGIKVRGMWLKYILQEAGFKGEGLRMAWAVAMRESRGHHNSHNDNPSTGDNSYGLFQINMLGSLGEARREKYGLEHNTDLFNPIKNAKIAYQMSNGGKNWSAWGIGSSSYNRGVSEPAVREWLAQYPRG